MQKLRSRRVAIFFMLFLGSLGLSFAFQNCARGFKAVNDSSSVAAPMDPKESSLPSDPIEPSPPSPQPSKPHANLTLSVAYRSNLDEMARLGSSRRANAPKVGIAYMVWHCMANDPSRNKVISEAKVTGQWGLIPEFHWREVPAATNSIQTYSATNKNLVQSHFAMLEQAQVDFLVVDFTNQSYAPGGPSEVAPQCMLDGFKNLLDVSVERGGKIKVVPWVSFKGNLHSYFLNLMGVLPQKNPNPYETALFKYQGKPLILASWDIARQQHDVEPAIAAVERAGGIVRKMWALHGGNLKDASGASVWSYQEMCQSGFREAQGNIECSQYTHPELASVSAAYQETFISEFRTAVPKFAGRTFLKQLKKAQSSQAPLLLINTWNEWIAQRFCLKDNLPTHLCYANNGSPINNHFPFDGRPVFTDVYDREYSRDLEPDTAGSEYYELMRDGIAAVKGLPVELQYTDFKEVTATVGGISGQTGHWWCNNNVDKNTGTIWVCIGSNCSTDATLGQVIRCGTR